MLAATVLPSNLLQSSLAPISIPDGIEVTLGNAAWDDLRDCPQNALSAFLPKLPGSETRVEQSSLTPHPEAPDPLYLLACILEWERSGEPSAAWEIIAASRSPHDDTRAHARALLERALCPPLPSSEEVPSNLRPCRMTEAGMRSPNDREIIESCMGCKAMEEGFFCRLSQPVLRSFDAASHHTVMSPSSMLFAEGQTPRGIFMICSGTVKLSTTSKEGKVLILKQAVAGEVLGLSAVISNTDYEMSAETVDSCQLGFIGRKDFMALLQHESEAGMRVALWLSREFQGAYRDIHDLVLARSSAGKLARLLLSCAPPELPFSKELPLRAAMTHEEMAQRIGSSRETVTRLLTILKKKG